jgi:hypothetical protein
VESASDAIESGLIVAASGSVGDQTAFHRRGRILVRERVTPVQPDTAFQQGRRTQLAFMYTRWSSLSRTQREQWAAYGSTFTHHGPLGDPRPLPGWQAFVYVNFTRYMAGKTRVESPPDVFHADRLSPVSFTIKEFAPRLTLIFDESDPWVSEDGAYLFVFASRGQTNTTNWFRGPYRYAYAVAGSSTSPPTSPKALGSGPFFLVNGDHWFGRCYTSRAGGDRSPTQHVGPFTVT